MPSHMEPVMPSTYATLIRAQARYDALEPEPGLDLNDMTQSEVIAYILSPAGRRDPAVDTLFLLANAPMEPAMITLEVRRRYLTLVVNGQAILTFAQGTTVAQALAEVPEAVYVAQAAA
jgi:hypothetical protein